MKTTFNGKPVGQWVFYLAIVVWTLGVVVSVSVGLHRDIISFGCGIVAAYLVLRGLKINDRSLV